MAQPLSLDREIDRRVQLAVDAASDEHRQYTDGVIAKVQAAIEISQRWPEWMRPQTAVEYLDSIGSETLRRWACEHLRDIRYRRGNEVWYRKQDLDELMSSRFERQAADVDIAAG